MVYANSLMWQYGQANNVNMNLALGECRVTEDSSLHWRITLPFYLFCIIQGTFALLAFFDTILYLSISGETWLRKLCGAPSLKKNFESGATCVESWPPFSLGHFMHLGQIEWQSDAPKKNSRQIEIRLLKPPPEMHSSKMFKWMFTMHLSVKV